MISVATPYILSVFSTYLFSFFITNLEIKECFRLLFILILEFALLSIYKLAIEVNLVLQSLHIL